MKEPGKAPQKGSPPGGPPPGGASKATKSDVLPRSRGLLFLIAILKKRPESGSSEDKR